jgi:hypothetical protein
MLNNKNDIMSYFSKQLNVPDRFVANYYTQAASITTEFYGKQESLFSEKEYDYLVETMKNMMGLEEKTTLKYLNSKKTIREFILKEDGEGQTPGVSNTSLTSSDYDKMLGNNTIVNKKDKSDDNEEDKEKLKESIEPSYMQAISTNFSDINSLGKDDGLWYMQALYAKDKSKLFGVAPEIIYNWALKNRVWLKPSMIYLSSNIDLVKKAIKTNSLIDLDEDFLYWLA